LKFELIKASNKLKEQYFEFVNEWNEYGELIIPSSARTIINNGGILKNEIVEGNEIIQRYWIKIK
jgi:predicted acetyltransferase